MSGGSHRIPFQSKEREGEEEEGGANFGTRLSVKRVFVFFLSFGDFVDSIPVSDLVDHAGEFPLDIRNVFF